jgi:hypothetical protein
VSDAPAPTRKAIDAGVAAALAAAAHTPDPVAEATPLDALTQVLETYRGIRPLLLFATRFPLLPRRWREALTLFIARLDTLTLTEPRIVTHFKAGRDL